MEGCGGQEKKESGKKILQVLNLPGELVEVQVHCVISSLSTFVYG